MLGVGCLAGCSGTSPSQSTETKNQATEAEAEGVSQDWLGDEPQMPQSFNNEIEADVVVVGLGMAGVCATRAACEAGASVVVFEKGPTFGLKSTCIHPWGSKQWVEHYPECAELYKRKDLAMQALSKAMLGRANARIMSRYLDDNGDTVDWFMGAFAPGELFYGTPDNNVVPEGETGIYELSYPYPANYDIDKEYYPCFLGCIDMLPDNVPFLEANMKKAEETGAGLTVLRNTPAVKLVKDGDRVTGVYAKDFDGTTYLAKAKHGVVLATGDFFGDEAMVKALLPRDYEVSEMYSVWSDPDAEGKQCNTGDGHRMGSWAGAKMQKDGCVMSHFVGGNGRTVGSMPWLYLDKRGQRFMNEDVQGQQLIERVRELPDITAYQVFDSRWHDTMGDMPYGHGKRPEASEAELAEAVKNGEFLTANTLEELFAQVEIDAKAAVESVAHYNDLCHKGEDEDFGKQARRMVPVETPPFYLDTFKATSMGHDLVTLSGLVSDEESRVYDENDQVIPGLFVAGNVQGCRFAVEYPEILQGNSLGMAMVYGRIAGTNAAKA